MARNKQNKNTDIDYDILANKISDRIREDIAVEIKQGIKQELADSYVEAHFRIKEEESRQEKIKTNEDKFMWYSIVNYPRFNGCWFFKIIKGILYLLVSPIILLSSRTKNLQNDIGIYSFLRMFNVLSLFLYQIILFCSMAVIGYTGYKSFKSSEVLFIILSIFIFWFLFFLFSAINIVRDQIKASNDKEAIISIAGVIVAIDAIIIGAIVAIYCANPI